MESRNEIAGCDPPATNSHSENDVTILSSLRLESGELFPDYEKRIFQLLRNQLKCPYAGVMDCQTTLSSRGGAGALCQGGFRLIQLKCAKTQGTALACGKCSRLADCLPNEDWKRIYKEEYEKACSAAILKNNATKKATQPRLSFIKKRKIAPGSPPKTSLAPIFEPIDDIDMDDIQSNIENFSQAEFQTPNETVVAAAQTQSGIAESELISMQDMSIESSNNELDYWKRIAREQIEKSKKLEKELELMKSQNAEIVKQNTEILAILKALQSTEKVELLGPKNEDIPRPSLEQEFPALVPSSQTQSVPEVEGIVNSPKLYNQVVASHLPKKQPGKIINPKKIKSIAAKALRPVGPPMEFAKVYMKIPNTRILKGHNPRDRRRVQWSILKSLELGQHIVDFSPIGLGILELICPASYRRCVEVTLQKSGVWLEKYDVQEVPTHSNADKSKSCAIKRLKFAYKRARTLAWKRTVLLGVPEEWHAEIINEASSNRDSILAQVGINVDSNSDMMLDVPEITGPSIGATSEPADSGSNLVTAL